jgi:hypothetical protein
MFLCLKMLGFGRVMIPRVALSILLISVNGVCVSEREEQSGIGVTARKALVVQGDNPMSSYLFLDLLQ